MWLGSSPSWAYQTSQTKDASINSSAKKRLNSSEESAYFCILIGSRSSNWVSISLIGVGSKMLTNVEFEDFADTGFVSHWALAWLCVSPSAGISKHGLVAERGSDRSSDNEDSRETIRGESDPLHFEFVFEVVFVFKVVWTLLENVEEGIEWSSWRELGQLKGLVSIEIVPSWFSSPPLTNVMW